MLELLAFGIKHRMLNNILYCPFGYFVFQEVNGVLHSRLPTKYSNKAKYIVESVRSYYGQFQVEPFYSAPE